jgi:SAM-dependent methyltransferase
MALGTSSPAREPLQASAIHSEPASARQIRKLLSELAREYPPDLIAIEESDVTRMTYNILLALRYAAPQPTVCDVAGGLSMFSLGLSALGCNTILIDDFGDDWHAAAAESVFGLFSRYGVQIDARDVIANGVNLKPESLDVIHCSGVMEHFHHSPRRLFHQLVAALRPGGIFLLGVPNRANLRKRVELPFGGAPWSPIESWYEPEVFRSHVREPDVPDMRYIYRDLGLEVLEVSGRNWQGHKSKRRLTRILARCGDHPLRLFPSLCSDIYIVGKKPNPD